jgi:SulP family sulfate permease
VLPALGVLLVGYTDFILTARAFTVPSSDDEGPGLDPNQELLALGAPTWVRAHCTVSR